jgi:hypothetical protein
MTVFNIPAAGLPALERAPGLRMQIRKTNPGRIDQGYETEACFFLLDGYDSDSAALMT